MSKQNHPSSIQSQFLETCDIPLYDFKIETFTLVVFGGAGDLSQRKLLPTVFHLYMEKELPPIFPFWASVSLKWMIPIIAT